jgi:hypothetical protein
MAREPLENEEYHPACLNRRCCSRVSGMKMVKSQSPNRAVIMNLFDWLWMASTDFLGITMNGFSDWPLSLEHRSW